MKLLALCFINFLYFAPFAYAMDAPQNQDDGSEDYELGEQLFSKYQFAKALDAYKVAADKEYPGASLRILYMINGLGFGVNLDCKLLKDYKWDKVIGVSQAYYRKIRKQAAWFQAKADSNKAIDQANLVVFYVIYAKNNMLNSAIECLKNVCKQADNSLVYILLSEGLKHQNGNSYNEESLKYLKIAADMGNPIAFNDLGFHYKESVSPRFALSYFIEGGKHDLPNSLVFLGKYAEKRNPSSSLKLLRGSACLGNKIAIESLKERYEKKGKYKKFQEWEMISCDFGYSNPDEISVQGYVPGMLIACWDENIFERCQPLLISANQWSLLPELWGYIVYIILKDEITKIVNAYNTSQR